MQEVVSVETVGQVGVNHSSAIERRRKMWFTDYIKAIKRQFRDVYGFTPRPGSADDDPIFDNIPDGEYPMTIEGKTDKVRIENGGINCCNFA